MGPILSFQDFLDMLRRRAWVILLVIVIGCGLSVFAALNQKHKYSSTEVIQVVQPKIADDLARSTVEGTPARRLQLIEQRVMARDSVLNVIRENNLYADMPALTDNEKVDLLRTSVNINGLSGNGSPDGWVSVVTVTAEMPTAQQAQQIAHEFARLTIELSNESRLEQARETLAFFTAREETLRDQISRVEEELAEYRKQNEIALPGTLEIRREEITSINSELLGISQERIRIERAADLSRRNDRPATAERKLADFNDQLTTLDAQEKLLRDRKGELENSLQSSPQVERRVGAFDRELDQLRGQLEDASSRRTEAEVGYRLETQSQSERLTVIEPANLPDYPFTRSRKKLAVAGGMVSVVMALALAFVLELMNPVMRTAAHMERDLGIRPVVSVPYLDTRRRRRLFRRDKRRDHAA
ncbi:GumC family protein [Pseudodonghicola flavimaris]|uniref:Wzz/FepE/Etk N-terminal domain-containing protein n=1 Tax=Pseudodonghicola flavimaris TaxID=3050036 RepID=A0ABT7F3J3_9RHOB|nr:Wzz/FepE/Etk N-terminal domain-containing protein [Pseudodonghicola flavimaris]MDK3019179.1 Wzz/FepE/Etk N-terminal domain-containing protein [Pseudodonghicola flavimaris]